LTTVHIDTTVCKGCGLCIYYCPRDVIVLSTQHNDKGYAVAEVSDPESCTGCRLCEIGCPDLAIFIERD
jgi:2-oxoglutarate ferredoxin oxidoreductase subunit delta